MSDDIKPALTAEQWETWRATGVYDGPGVIEARNDERDPFVAHGLWHNTHPLAALALDGKAYGPKHEWLDALDGTVTGPAEREALLREVYAFVAALLPPAP